MTIVLLLVLAGSFACAEVVRVCAGCRFATLESAIRVAAAGDTIVIEAGRYNSTHVLITKPLTIIGNDNPILDGGGTGTVITVRSVPVSIRNVVITNTGFSSLDEYAAIKLIESTASTVENIEAQRCAFGVVLYRSSQCILSNIRCEGTSAAESLSGNGIHLWKSPSCRIKHCYVAHHRDGLYFEFSRHCSIESNESVANMRYGLHFMFSDSNAYRNNVFRSNAAGVAVMYSRNVLMDANVFADNWGPSSYGLLLKDINQSRISNNVFDRNTVAIYMEGTDGTRFTTNLFRANGWALKALGSCIGDTLEDNSFVANTFDVMTNAYHTELICRRNYWDQYRGYDLDHDGLGDVPHRPVSVFSMLVERVPTAVLLLRSFVVELLTYVERVIPSLIPAALLDPMPRMAPPSSATPSHFDRTRQPEI
ncbi:MAG: hypothetical protein KatS3mg039_0541 [Candidatus Kapaibacterium sp.]|nr:MAG: hypothetical protein KatS3mg039_0541 [Candidatus Kapabacteria bacterium]